MPMKQLINPDQIPIIAVDFMNETHFEDIGIINELYNRVISYLENEMQDATDIDEQYALWYEHTVQHFKREEEAMLAIGFPPYPKHKAAHDEKLAIMKQVQTDWMKNRNIEALKHYLEEDLVNWIINHIQTMDRITAIVLDQVNN